MKSMKYKVGPFEHNSINYYGKTDHHADGHNTADTNRIISNRQGHDDDPDAIDSENEINYSKTNKSHSSRVLTPNVNSSSTNSMSDKLKGIGVTSASLTSSHNISSGGEQFHRRNPAFSAEEDEEDDQVDNIDDNDLVKRKNRAKKHLTKNKAQSKFKESPMSSSTLSSGLRTGQSNNEELEVVVMPSSSSIAPHENDGHAIDGAEPNSDTNSSSESGFGTNDDELDNGSNKLPRQHINSNSDDVGIDMNEDASPAVEPLANEASVQIQIEPTPVSLRSTPINSPNSTSTPNHLDSIQVVVTSNSTADNLADAKKLNHTPQRITSNNQNQQLAPDQGTIIDANALIGQLQKGSSEKQQQQQQQHTNSNRSFSQQPMRSKNKFDLSNRNNADDIDNILNDNSSINSSSSSSASQSNGSCCSNTIEKLNRFYYSCFCCYSTTSHTTQTPFIWSWLSIFCCCCPLLGGISLYLTHRSKKLKLKQKYELAEKYSNYAEKLNIASLIVGIIFYAIAFFMITLVIFIYWKHRN